MKAKVYLRVAKHPNGRNAPYKVAASNKPNYEPLTVGSGYSERALPTLAFALVLNIPDESFKPAEKILAEIDIPEDLVAVAAEVTEA